MTTRQEAVWNPKTHDYTDGAWGHDVNIIAVKDGGNQLRACGWGYGVNVGDYLILSANSRYRVEDIQYKSDPPDMWGADLFFAPREKP